MRPSGLTPLRDTEVARCHVHMGPDVVLWAEILDTARTTSGITIFYLKVTTRLLILENDKATAYVVTALDVFLQTPVRDALAGAP